MPSGVTHDRIAVAASPLLAGAATITQHWAGRPPLEAAMGGLLLTASHLACSHWLSPDLDLGSATIDERWGVLRPIWWPYERLIPHRHWLSHSGVSALLRLAYLFLALNAVLVVVALVILAEGALVSLLIANTPGSAMVWAFLVEQYLRMSTAGIALALEHPAEAVAIALGALAADLLHTGADRIDTARKIRRRYRRRPARRGAGTRRRT
jgi:uncharacterized metal-binding protein